MTGCRSRGAQQAPLGADQGQLSAYLKESGVEHALYLSGLGVLNRTTLQSILAICTHVASGQPSIMAVVTCVLCVSGLYSVHCGDKAWCCARRAVLDA